MQALLSVKQAAEVLGVKPDTVKYLRRTRQLPGTVIARKLKFFPEDVEAYARSCRDAQPQALSLYSEKQCEGR